MLPIRDWGPESPEAVQTARQEIAEALRSCGQDPEKELKAMVALQDLMLQRLFASPNSELFF